MTNYRSRALRACAALAVAAGAASPAEPPPSTPTPTAPGVHEHLSTVVMTCVDAAGQIKDVLLVRSSGYPQIDQAALEVARAARYSPATERGKPKRSSCVKFKVKFVIRDGKPVLDGPAPDAAAPPPPG